VVNGTTYSDKTDSKMWFMVLHIATRQIATVVYGNTYSDKTESKLWFMVIHIATRQTANCGSWYYI